jgi:uridine kinase
MPGCCVKVVHESVMCIHALLLLLLLLLPDDDVRLARRIQRDVQHRGRDVASVIHQYTRFVKPAFDQYVAPSRR